MHDVREGQVESQDFHSSLLVTNIFPQIYGVNGDQVWSLKVHSLAVSRYLSPYMLAWCQMRAFPSGNEATLTALSVESFYSIRTLMTSCNEDPTSDHFFTVEPHCLNLDLLSDPL